MQAQQLPLTEIRQKITAANSVLIVLPQLQTIDNVAAGLALFLALEQNFANGQTPENNKKITIASGSDMTVAYQRLYGVGSISKTLGSKNLVITLNTGHENIEKVTSDNENGKFNLVIETKSGIGKLTNEDVRFSYRGVDADLVITVGLATPEQAGALLSQEEKLFTNRETIAISNQPGAIAFGTLNLQDPMASSLCEMVAKVMRFLKLEVNGDMATNLLAGIEAATNNFMFKTTAETFAAISWCMKVGGQRNHLTSPNPAQSAFGREPGASPFGFTDNPFGPFAPAPQETSYPPIPGYDQEQAGEEQPQPSQQQPQPQSQTEMQDADPNADANQAPSKDWLEPKIFRNNA